MRGRWKIGVVALVAALASLTPAPDGSAAPTDQVEPGPRSLNLTSRGRPRPPEPAGDAAALTASALEPAAVTPGTRFAGFNSMTPVRMLDTRAGAPLGPAGAVDLVVAGRSGVPADARSVVLNLTVVDPSVGGFLTVWPAGTSRPGTSNLNMVAGQTVANLVAVRLGATGSLSIHNDTGSSHVLVDVVAWSRDDGHFVGVTPSRVLDTRAGAALGAGGRRDLRLLGTGGVPASGVSAVVVNVTATEPTASTYLTVWPSGQAQPNASSLNTSAGRSVPNLVFAPVGADGSISIFNEQGSVHVLVDVVGYIPSGAAYIPVNPQRVMDTRIGAGTYGQPIGNQLRKPVGRLAADQTLVLDFDSALDDALPTTTFTTMAALVLNVTAVDATDTTYLSVWPTGVSRPNASNVNLSPGGIVPNAVMVRPGSLDRINIYNAVGSVHVLVDLVGYVPLQNADDQLDVDDVSKFHVLYVRGSDSTADIATAVANIRTEVAALDGWFSAPAQANGQHLNFDRVASQVEVNVLTYPQYTTGQLVNWDETDCQSYPLLRQLADDGWGNGQNRRYLVYLDGDRRVSISSPCSGFPTSTTTCGIAFYQYTTVFMASACGSVNGTTTANAVGAAANSAQVALHEMLHGLGAVPTCAPHYTTQGGGHVETKISDPGQDNRFDLMYFSAAFQPKQLDIGRDDYFGHGNPNCTDLQDSPFLSRP